MTPQQYVQEAIAKSSKNQADDRSIAPSEGHGIVTRSIRAFYTIAARVNPLYFARKANHANVAGYWNWPTEAETVFAINASDGAEVVLVPFDQQNAEPSKKAIYYFGQNFYPASTNPASGTITFSYSKKATVTSYASGGYTTEVDSSWPADFDELLVLEVACHLARKDGRLDELASLKQDRDQWLRLFVSHLEGLLPHERRRHGLRRISVSPTLVPISELLAGGTQVAL